MTMHQARAASPPGCSRRRRSPRPAPTRRRTACTCRSRRLTLPEQRPRHQRHRARDHVDPGQLRERDAEVVHRERAAEGHQHEAARREQHRRQERAQVAPLARPSRPGAAPGSAPTATLRCSTMGCRRAAITRPTGAPTTRIMMKGACHPQWFDRNTPSGSPMTWLAANAVWTSPSPGRGPRAETGRR